MNAITIEHLGLTKDDIADRIVQAAAAQLLLQERILSDEDGEEFTDRTPSRFAKELQERVRIKIDDAISDIAGRNVLPNVSTYVENLCLQETNRWGEKVGKSVTFTEYLVQRAEAYMQEEVNYEGKSQKEAGGYSWSKAQTRIAHIVHKHIHYTIESALKNAYSDLNKQIVDGIEKTVRIQLDEISKKLKVSARIRA